MQNNRDKRCNQNPLGRSGHESQELNLFVPWSRGLSYISSEKPTYKNWQMHDNRTSTWIDTYNYKTQKHHIRQVPIFKAQQQPNESLETFYSRLREAGSHCRFEHLEEDIIKDLFISNMNNTAIQMDLLSEVRPPQQVLNYAINRERRQANQKEILRTNSTSTYNQVTHIRQNRRTQAILPTPQSGKIEPCWKCGNPFTPNHLQNCPARNTICKICKKQGHFSSMCKAPMPKRRRPPQQSTSSPQSRYQNTHTPRPGNNQTRRVRHIKDNTDQTETQYYEGESDEPDDVDAEAALYIKELTEEWANVNLIRSTTFHAEKNSVINNEGTGEFWVATTTNNKRIVWLADAGSPRTFMNKETANELLLHISKAKIVPYKEKEKFKCFNNKQIKIEEVLHLDLKSGSWNAPDCQILLVENKTNNIMGRDILRKLEITLTASKNAGKKILQISDTSKESNIIKWILKKYPSYYTIRKIKEPHCKTNHERKLQANTAKRTQSTPPSTR